MQYATMPMLIFRAWATCGRMRRIFLWNILNSLHRSCCYSCGFFVVVVVVVVFIVVVVVVVVVVVCVFFFRSHHFALFPRSERLELTLTFVKTWRLDIVNFCRVCGIKGMSPASTTLSLPRPQFSARFARRFFYLQRFSSFIAAEGRCETSLSNDERAETSAVRRLF